MEEHEPTDFPDRLFRFRKANSKHIASEIGRALERRELFFSSAHGLNDPFELSPTFLQESEKEILSVLRQVHGRRPVLSRTALERNLGRSVSRSEYRQETKNLRPNVVTARRVGAQLSNKLDELPKKHTLCCLSVERDNIPMWAHYASEHKGYCLEFSWDSAGLREIHHLSPQPVKYQAERPEISISDFYRLAFKKNEDSRDNGQSERVFDRLFFTKSEHWSYENEWRILGHIRSEPTGYHRVGCLRIEAIRLGLEASDATRKQVLSAVGNRLPVFQARQSLDRFEFQYQQLC